MKLHRMLAATDLSAPARHAVARAFRIAAETGAALEVMHVVNQRALDDLRAFLTLKAAAVETRLLDDARSTLLDLVAELGAAHGVSAGVQLHTGTVLRTLLDQADARDADLLVVGARGEDYLTIFCSAPPPNACCDVRCVRCWWSSRRHMRLTAGYCFRLTFLRGRWL